MVPNPEPHRPFVVTLPAVLDALVEEDEDDAGDPAEELHGPL